MLGSATYCMTRILTGQLDAYVDVMRRMIEVLPEVEKRFLDVGKRMIEVLPEAEKRFREVGNGHVLNNAPYDVEASSLILEEAGCTVMDAAGRVWGPVLTIRCPWWLRLMRIYTG